MAKQNFEQPVFSVTLYFRNNFYILIWYIRSFFIIDFGKQLCCLFCRNSFDQLNKSLLNKISHKKNNIYKLLNGSTVYKSLLKLILKLLKLFSLIWKYVTILMSCQ